MIRAGTKHIDKPANPGGGKESERRKEDRQTSFGVEIKRRHATVGGVRIQKRHHRIARFEHGYDHDAGQE